MDSIADPVRGLYQHYKGGFYEMLGIAEDVESGDRCVVYQDVGLMENLLDPDPNDPPRLNARVVETPNRGSLSVCSIKRFTEAVDGGVYHHGARVPRFRLVIPAPHR